MKTLALPFFWPLYSWMALSILAPSTVANFDFMHVKEEYSLRISVSKNSPPLAAILDEKITPLIIEPKEEMQLGKKSRALIAGSTFAWPRLKKVSEMFLKEQKRQERLLKIQKVAEAKAIAKAVTEIPIEVPIKKFKTQARISELMSLVTPVKYTYAPEAISKSMEKNPSVSAAASSFNNVSEQKSLSWQKNQKEQTVEKSLIVNAPVEIRKPAVEQKKIAGLDPYAVPLKKEIRREEVFALDGVGGEYKIRGAVELSGGLAVTDKINKLSVLWMTGNQKIEGAIDFNTGQFIINTPTLMAGKVIAKVMDENDQVIGRGDFDLDGAISEASQKSIEGIKLMVEPVYKSSEGEVVSAYSYDNIKIYVPGAEVFGPAQTRIAADSQGQFKFAALGSGSTYFLEASAPENWGTRIISESRRKERVPMFSNKMIQSLYDLIGEPSNFDNAIIWGEVKKRGKSVSGVQVAMAGVSDLKPIYFNELRLPDKNLKQTTENGLYAFVKVSPGLHLVMAQKEGRELPSVLVSASPGLVSYAELNMKALELVGRVIDPISNEKVSANISVVGSRFSTAANQEGVFAMKIPSTDAVIFIEARGGNDYFVSREGVPRSQAKKINLSLYKKNWVNQQLIEAQAVQREDMGMILGHIQGPVFHVALDNEPLADQNILYFNSSGKLEPGRLESSEGDGRFILTNVKPGAHTVLLTSADGQISMTRLIVAEAGVISTVSGLLNP